MIPNRLSQEKSPYLLQHAHNPVDWYPWSVEAFEHARSENKPIFLSIGYATCHWCHVMEKETFENEEAAGYLNDTFVSIKVDREERPDIDAVYMAACQMLSGGGGWPLTIVMTADKKPFFAGTYLPLRGGSGRLGVIELCQQVKNLWVSDHDRVRTTAANIAEKIGEAFSFNPGDDLDVDLIDKTYAQIARIYDPVYGGFGSSPKFPTPHQLLFLLRHYNRTGISLPLEMVQKTLKAMRMGGIWDHVGFGFHRYSTDKEWLLPHFEKMLYDQALLAMAYLETYQTTKDPFFAHVAEEIFAYVLRDMTSEEGAFFAAEDADSEGEEGKFYVWTLNEFKSILGEKEADGWTRVFSITPEGNFFDEATRQKTGTNILHLRMPMEKWAPKLGMDKDELLKRWNKTREVIFQARENRIRPLRDDKILTDWNGLMIAAFALGARILDNEEYARIAQKSVHFILSNLRDRKGKLLHRFRDREAGITAHADDYAFLILGLLELYETTCDQALLTQAVNLQEQMLEDYWDQEKGGFFLTAERSQELPARPKELYDGAIPSGNSVAFHNLLKLTKLTGKDQWERQAHELARAFLGTVNTQPQAFTYFLSGYNNKDR
ncbi:thioredoxin domain-containing protein [Thermodesulfobacteriota bacterium]